MVTVKAGSHVYGLLQLLSVAGEFPASALHLLGNERVVKALVHRLESVQDIRFTREGQVFHTKVLQVNGQRDARTVKLYSGVLPMLDEMYPGALAYYMDAFQQHRFSGNIYHIGRNHRVGEAIAITMTAGIEFRPYALPRLQNKVRLPIVPDAPSFYIARDFKDNAYDEMDKTTFTRIVGAIFYPGGCYAVYNTRNAVMKWSGTGEFKALDHLTNLARRNAGLPDVNSALLLGNDPEKALQTILESDKAKRKSTRVDAIYPHVHFIPLNADGIKLLQILTLPDWNERILDALFEENQRRRYGSMEYDARIDGIYVLSHLDSDLARLIHFREGLRIEKDTKNIFEVLCYPWQRDYLRAYLGERVQLKIIPMEVLQDALE